MEVYPRQWSSVTACFSLFCRFFCVTCQCLKTGSICDVCSGDVRTSVEWLSGVSRQHVVVFTPGCQDCRTSWENKASRQPIFSHCRGSAAAAAAATASFILIMLPTLWKRAICVAFVRPPICLSVVYIANNSRTQRPSMPKFGGNVPHLRCDSHTSFKVGGQG